MRGRRTCPVRSNRAWRCLLVGLRPRRSGSRCHQAEIILIESYKVLRQRFTEINVDCQCATYTLRRNTPFFSALISALNMEKAHPRTPNGHKKKSGKPCKIKVSRIKCKKNDFFLSAAEETAEIFSQNRRLNRGRQGTFECSASALAHPFLCVNRSDIYHFYPQSALLISD